MMTVHSSFGKCHVLLTQAYYGAHPHPPPLLRFRPQQNQDAHDDDELDIVAAMEKREGTWFWAEWDADGESIYSGDPDTCTGCHQSGADMVRAFGLPR